MLKDHRRLDGQDLPVTCILHGPHGRGGQEVCPLPVEGKGIPIQLPSLRSVIGPLGLSMQTSWQVESVLVYVQLHWIKQISFCTNYYFGC